MHRIYAILVALVLTATATAADDECLTCHGQGHQAKTEAQIIDTDVLAGSIHQGLACADCHTVDPKTRHAGNRAVFCARCHLKEAEGYNQSAHVKGRSQGIDKLPTCIICHGGHDVLAVADPKAKTNHANSARICIKCHEDQQLTDKTPAMPSVARIKSYENSVHGTALLVKGNMQAPACVDCHGSHSFLPADDPNSPIFKTHIAQTCGKCHGDIMAVYNESIHGISLAKGVLESPTCTNCHGEHEILKQSDPGSKVFAANVSKTCSDCHASEKIVAKVGLKADRIATFKESFHGIGTALGDTTVANCASCHGVHNIFAQSDPRSTINPTNIEKTCGECHEGLPADFAQGAIHVSAKEKSSGGAWYVRKFYIWFISILILIFIIYRVLEYKRRVKRI